MFDLIINPIVTLLVFLYSTFGDSIVISIALVTVAIRLATSPLLIQQQRSTRAMQEVQPQIAKLREKYKNDREKLAQEQMKLFRENNINPLGGCLPLFIQLPILLALYRAINSALASTPFELIDLSDRLMFGGVVDGAIPLNNFWLGMDLTLAPTSNPAIALSFPILVAVTTWLQTRLTLPAPKKTGNAQQDQTAQMTRTMTTVMPFMFGFFSLSFSVGLSIYFVVSNVVGIIQYTLMGRAEWGRLLGREPEEDDDEAETAKVSANGKGDKADKSAKASNGAKANGSKDKQEAATLDESVPTRPSGRKDKKMRKASGK